MISIKNRELVLNGEVAALAEAKSGMIDASACVEEASRIGNETFQPFTKGLPCREMATGKWSDDWQLCREAMDIERPHGSMLIEGTERGIAAPEFTTEQRTPQEHKSGERANSPYPSLSSLHT
jgi:hypothetical protein